MCRSASAGWSLNRRSITRGREVIDRLYPEHTQRVRDAFAVLDEAEKRMLAEICLKLAA